MALLLTFLKSESIAIDLKIRRYVLDRYTAFEALFRTKHDTKAIAKAHQEADRILLTWRRKSPGI